MTTLDRTADEARDALVERLFDASLSAIDLLTVYIGDRLGCYRALAEGGRATAAELAAATGTHPRYAREWLEQQAVSGLLAVDDAGAAPEARRYALPPGHAEPLLDPDSLAYMAPLARIVVGCTEPLPQILSAFRDGGGVPWTAYGADGREGQADMNRPQFLNRLASQWLPGLPDVDARLREPGARVADIACGAGWSSIAIARGYPQAHVDAFDLDEASIDLARANAAAAGVADRVHFHVRDIADVPGGDYDLVTVFEAIHDMARPVEALAAMRALAGARGAVLVMDERAADAFTAPGDGVERFLYGASVLLCLPTGMSEQPSAATGTVMRADVLRGYAEAAGFADVEVLDIEHDMFRFYRLR